MGDHSFHDECGVFGIFGHPESSNIAYLGLYALQHRGQESAGIVSSDGESLHTHRGMGLVADVFNEQTFKNLPGQSAIGHVRYSTTGASHVRNAQPFAMDYRHGAFAMAHNGNIVNDVQLRRELEDSGSIFRTTTDTEIIAHLIAASEAKTTAGRIMEALAQVQGAYSMVFLTETRLIASRDPLGFRPLVLGSLDGAWVVASETCAFDLIGARYEREIEPGETLEITASGLTSYRAPAPAMPRRCIFEYIYFARPDSILFGANVYRVRKSLGSRLAAEQPAKADIVIAVPDSGVPAAMGFSEASGIPYENGLTRNHYVGRTFIEPTQQIRHFGVKIKLNPNRGVLDGKRVVVVDDSIVRGTTSQKLVNLIRHAGATEVHMRISSPPTTGPCFYGVATPTKEELIASSQSAAEICKFIGADSLGYLSIGGLKEAVNQADGGFCDACFSGDYPVTVNNSDRRQMRLFEDISSGSRRWPRGQTAG
ncbi:MAG: amidophosphoribosyltransferase [Deltaproteobacteria bacterium]|nr:amidophosphoribosyltransferase [Deltaproteobacteria bacterium]